MNRLGVCCNRMDNLYLHKSRAYLAVFLAVLDTLLFSGIQYGFTALIPVLKSEKVFLSSCAANENGCKQQDDIYSYAFIVWTVLQYIAMFPLGMLYDKLGLRAIKVLSVTLIVLGSICYAFVSPGSDWLLFLAGIFTSIGSISTLICNFSTSILFPKYSTFISSLISGSYDSSTIIFTIIRVLYQNANVHYRIPFLIHAAAAFVSGTVLVVFFLTRMATNMEQYSICNIEQKIKEQKKKSTTTLPLTNVVEEETQIQSPEDEAAAPIAQEESPEMAFARIKEEMFPTARSVLHSHAFLIFLVFLSVLQLRFSFFLAQLYQQITTKFASNKDTQTKLLTDLSYFMFTGILVAPIGGFITEMSKKFIFRFLGRRQLKLDSEKEKWRFYWMCMNGYQPVLIIQITATTVYSFLIFIENEGAWYFAYLCFLLQRELMFSTFAALVLQAFPIRFFGTTYGLIAMLAGIFSLIQYGFLQAAPDISNGILLAVTAGTYLIPLWMFLLVRFPGALCGGYRPTQK